MCTIHVLRFDVRYVGDRAGPIDVPLSATGPNETFLVYADIEDDQFCSTWLVAGRFRRRRSTTSSA